MAKQYDDEMKGILFAQEKKTDTHPDYKGHIQIDGVRHWVSGWHKETSKGAALSLSVQKANTASEAYSKPPATAQNKDTPYDFLNDEIPF